MREIKFRAWDKEKEKMYIGVEMPQGLWGFLDSFRLSIINHKKSWKDCIFMQYTGLKDKNGKEIYEGDIVLMFQPNIPQWRMQEDRKILEIRWDEEYANWYLQRIDKEDPSNPGGRWSLHLVKDMELIGNIYENPELLKK